MNKSQLVEAIAHQHPGVPGREAVQGCRGKAPAIRQELNGSAPGRRQAKLMIFSARATFRPCSSARSKTTRWPMRRYLMCPDPSVDDWSMTTSVRSSIRSEPVLFSTS
jgi:hypothetical protein